MILNSIARAFGLGIISVALSVQSHADPVGTVNIKWTANIYQWSCTVSSASSNQIVPLGTWNTSELTKNKKTRPVPFSISLSGCNSNTVAVSFLGTADSTNSKYLALTADSTAKNVAIEISDSNQNTISLNQMMNPITIDSSGAVNMNFFANYVTYGTGVTAGTANADATFTLTYQ